MSQSTIYLGGINPERLYLKDLNWTLQTGQQVMVERTVISDDAGHEEHLEDMVARHIGRYALVGLFCRPKYRVLDFPCGSGYAAEALSVFGIDYEGRELDPLTVDYARRVYDAPGVRFDCGDLTKPRLDAERYDVIACIEGLEHIGSAFQSPLIGALKRALKRGGILIVSSPENATGVSGPSLDNTDHAWELTKVDFLNLLREHFPAEKIEVVTHKAVLDPGGLMTCLYGICHNG